MLFSFPNFDWVKEVVIFWVDNSLSVHTDNNKKDILVLGKGPSQELYDTTIMTEAEYSFNCSRSQRKLYYVFIIIEATAFCLLMPQKYTIWKQKTLK